MIFLLALLCFLPACWLSEKAVEDVIKDEEKAVLDFVEDEANSIETTS